MGGPAKYSVEIITKYNNQAHRKKGEDTGNHAGLTSFEIKEGQW